MARCPTESEKTLRIIAGLLVFFLPFTALCLLLSIFQITALYTAAPGFVGFAACIAAAVWYGATQQVIAQHNKRKQELTAMASCAVPMTVLLVVSLILTLSPYTMPMSDVVAARLGAVSDSSINIWARSPPPAAEFSVRYRHSGAANSDWSVSAPAILSEAADYSATLTLANLTPATVYEYIVVFDAEASEHSATDLRGTFRTLPTAFEPATLRFTSASCLYVDQAIEHLRLRLWMVSALCLPRW
jgi:hypothetical protein